MTSSTAQSVSDGLGRLASFHRSTGRPGASIAAKTPATAVTAAFALSCLTLLGASGLEPEPPPLAPASLDLSQAEAVHRVNTTGATAFAGWTWRYEVLPGE